MVKGYRKTRGRKPALGYETLITTPKKLPVWTLRRKDFKMQKPARKIKHPRILAGSITAISVIFLAVAVLLTINNGVLATMAAFISGNSDVISESKSIPTESQPSDLPDESSIPGTRTR